MSSATAEPAKLPSRMVPRAEICRLFGVCQVTVTTWVKDGRLPKPVLIGSRQYWPAEELGEFLNARRGA